MKRYLILLMSIMALSFSSCNIENDNSNTQKEANSKATEIVESKIEITETEISKTDKAESSLNEEKKESTYSQSYPVKDYQKAYAEFLNSHEIEYNSAWMIHIDQDTVPELSLQMGGSSAYLYGFDGNDVYEICNIGLDSNTGSYSYRPFLGMFAYYKGSVMNGTRHMIVHVIKNENGRLKQVEEVHIELPERVGECTGRHIYGFEETVMYDVYVNPGYDLGESWRQLDNQTCITNSKIEYWLNNR